METKKNHWFWLRKCIARSFRKIKRQIKLSCQFTAFDFTHLKNNSVTKNLRLISYKAIQYFKYNTSLTCRSSYQPPKYQNSPRKVTPQPSTISVSLPYSKFKWSSKFPKKFYSLNRHKQCYQKHRTDR